MQFLGCYAIAFGFGTSINTRTGTRICISIVIVIPFIVPTVPYRTAPYPTYI